MERDVYSGRLKLDGEEHHATLMAANNCANSLINLKRYQEAKSLMRKMIPVARRVLAEGDDTMLRMRWINAMALYRDDGATLDDLRESVTTLEQTEQIARRVLGGAHPVTLGIEPALGTSRAVLRARETGDVSSLREAEEAMTPR